MRVAVAPTRSTFGLLRRRLPPPEDDEKLRSRTANGDGGGTTWKPGVRRSQHVALACFAHADDDLIGRVADGAALEFGGDDPPRFALGSDREREFEAERIAES